MPCRLSVESAGFQTRNFELESLPPFLTVHLAPAGLDTEVRVEALPGELAPDSTASHGVLSQSQLSSMPFYSHATGFTDILSRTTPGVAADSNGFAHPLGEHADTSISLDGQPITDQQAKVFANQIDPSIIQSLTATTGAPPADYGDKTSLVVEVSSRSGLGKKPSGEYLSEYGSFGSWSSGASFGAGSPHWGSFVALHASGSRRFLDTPELRPIHAHGNISGLFHRLDWQPNEQDSLHWNFGVARSWFQTPNSYDTELTGQDQRSQIRNVNFAVGWNHIFSPTLLLSFTPFFRKDEAQYFPSANPFSDSTATLAQLRTLTNTGYRLQMLRTRGGHTLKVGHTYWQTMLRENFSIGITDPNFNPVCLDSGGNPVAATNLHDPTLCNRNGYIKNPAFKAGLLEHDLSRGGSRYRFRGSATVEQASVYLQDDEKWGNLLLNLGLRYDWYNGLSIGQSLQPRVGLGWNLQRSHTRLRASYARLYETPYNENLILANQSQKDASQENPFGALRSNPVRPGTRNQFNVGLIQQFGKHLTVDADYYWKFTHTAFDFDTLFNTPITFSVALRKSKIDGLALRLNVENIHNLTLSAVMGHVRARFFTPQVGGLIFNSTPGSSVFRIDHGEEFEQTTSIRYQLPRWKRSTHEYWLAGAWRFNSGLALPDTVPTYLNALQLTANEQAQMGLFCGQDKATTAHAIRSCSEELFGSTRIRIPRLGTQNDDKNPVRVSPRHLLDVSAGDDRLLGKERMRIGARVTVVNVLNKEALYNFLSTFSGTHFVAPRSIQGSIRLMF